VGDQPRPRVLSLHDELHSLIGSLIASAIALFIATRGWQKAEARARQDKEDAIPKDQANSLMRLLELHLAIVSYIAAITHGLRRPTIAAHVKLR
jgi:hypothetical protein